MEQLTLREAADKLLVSVDRLRKWHLLGLITCVPGASTKTVTQAEFKRIKAMMYPDGLPVSGLPLDVRNYEENMSGVKASWAQHLAEWGLLRAGKTPTGLLVVKDTGELEVAAKRLASAPQAFDICTSYTARDLVLVSRVESLLRQKGLITAKTTH